MTLHVELPTMRRERRLSGSSFEAALGKRMASVRRNETISRIWNLAPIFEFSLVLQEASRFLAKEE